jgi:alkanesulfonate monooxygenase SsuD/methylene tetrahydromethanopterin reductase-like flavin-dependent oxidoreductase (luciferase family)
MVALDEHLQAVHIPIQNDLSYLTSLIFLHGDHLMTSGSPEHLCDNVFPQFMDSAKSLGRDPSRIEKCMYIDDGHENLKKLEAKYRLSAGSLTAENSDERDGRKIEASTASFTDKYILDKTCLFSSPDQFIQLIDEYRRIGMNHFSEIGHTTRSEL